MPSSLSALAMQDDSAVADPAAADKNIDVEVELSDPAAAAP
ncbi:hypothetical protein [Nocardia salmonicida]|nr:hypothetical protein [Nocardia salmonicida]